MEPIKQGGASSSESAAKHSASIDMKPTNHNGDAASSEPAANHSASPTKLDLGVSPPELRAARDAHLEAMQLGDPSSFSELTAEHDASTGMEPTKEAGETSSLEPVANHTASTAAASSNLALALQLQAIPSPQQPQQRQGLAPTMLPDAVQMLRETHLYEEGESSTRAGYVSPRIIGSIRHYGEHDVRFATVDLPYPPVAEAQIQYQPSTSYPQAGAAANLFAAASQLRGYGAFSPYAYAVANQSAQAQAALQEFRANLLCSEGPMKYSMISESPEQVVQLLAAGDEEVRHFVLAEVTHDTVYDLMKRCNMYAVFVALLHACEERHDAEGFCRIAQAAAASDGMGFLMSTADTHYGEKALKELIRAVGPYGRPCEQLIKCLLDERLMFKDNGVALLRHFFAVLPYDCSMIIVQFAIKLFWELCRDQAGRICLEECFVTARDNERHDLESTICNNTTLLAIGQQSNIFLQEVFKRGSDGFKNRIRAHVWADLLNLCFHACGNYVVQTCFLRTPSREYLLHAFLKLPDHKLAELVRGKHSSCVVSNLLRDCRFVLECWAQMMELALPIERLPAEVLELENARKVMVAVRKVIPSN